MSDSESGRERERDGGHAISDDDDCLVSKNPYNSPPKASQGTSHYSTSGGPSNSANTSSGGSRTYTQAAHAFGPTGSAPGIMTTGATLEELMATNVSLMNNRPTPNNPHAVDHAAGAADMISALTEYRGTDEERKLAKEKKKEQERLEEQEKAARQARAEEERKEKERNAAAAKKEREEKEKRMAAVKAALHHGKDKSREGEKKEGEGN